jgi:tetratricopeptide (TPR) repeat protein
MCANKNVTLAAVGIILLSMITITGCTGAEKIGDKKAVQIDENAKLQQEAGQLKTENAVMEKAVKAYEKSATDLRWGIGIITGLISCILALAIAFAVYVIFKDRQEYELALKRAEDAATETQQWKQKAQEAVAGIDKEVVKMKEIENWAKDPAKKVISNIRYETEAERKKIQEEAEIQRKISELWAEGLRAALEGRYEDSCRCWNAIVSIKPDRHDAWNAWGNALLGQARDEKGAKADRLFTEAYAKFQKAVEIKPDMHAAWFNWGNALSEQAKNKEGVEADRLFAEAYTKYQKAVEIKPDKHDAWYNWGDALLEQAEKKEGSEADKLYAEAYAKYQKAVEIKPDMYKAWHNWGVALSRQAEKKEGDEKQKLLQEAKEKFSKAEQIKKGEGG